MVGHDGKEVIGNVNLTELLVAKRKINIGLDGF